MDPLRLAGSLLPPPADYLHFKDVDPQVYQRAIHEGIDFFTACAKGVMCPLGGGIGDYPAIKDLSCPPGVSGLDNH